MNAGEDFLGQVQAGVAPGVLGSGMAHGVLVLEIAPEGLLPLVRHLKDACGFDMFLDVTAVDWPQRRPRFDVVWPFYSTRPFVRLRVEPRREGVRRHVASADDEQAPRRRRRGLRRRGEQHRREGDRSDEACRARHHWIR